MERLTAALGAMAPLALAALVLWVLGMVSVPIIAWLRGERGRHVGVVLGVLLQATTVLILLGGVWPTGRLGSAVIGVCGLAWLAEFVGSHTGIPFGRYRYTDRLRPQIGKVPVLIPCAWLMMLPPAWAVAAAVAPGAPRAVHAGLAALAFTVWDLFLDPQMVAWGYWVWEPRAGRRTCYGIPWTNYAGWILMSALITWLVGPAGLPVRPLVLVYSVTWALQAFGQGLFWGLPGPAIVGGLAMGVMVALAWR